MAIDAIYSICETDGTEVRSKEFKSALSKGNIDGKRTVIVMPSCPILSDTPRRPTFSE